MPEFPLREVRAREHFSAIGLDVTFFNGIYAAGFGVDCFHPYNLDRKPEDGDFFVGTHPTGIFLSHYMLWSALTLQPDPYHHIIEIDACFEDGWRDRFEQALKDVPADFDMLFTGSCCTGGQIKTHVAGDVYAIKHLMCNHSIVYSAKALPILLAQNRDCYAPIDISVMLHSLPTLKSYAVLPRIVSQFDTVIPI